jgi:hypothetical protein
MLIFASVAGAQSSPSEYPPPPPSPLAPPDWEGDLLPLVGDMDQDGMVTMADVMLLRQYRAALAAVTDSQLAVTDTDNDEMVTMADAMHIMQYRADPDGGLGILYKPLWEWPADASLKDPRGSNAG